MRNSSDISLRAYLLAALIALTTLPALAQPPGSPEQDNGSNRSSSTATQPSTIQPGREQRTETAQQSADDAQLPAYLQHNPNAEDNGTAYDPWEHYNRHVYRFNKRVDRALLKLLALTYVRIVPEPVRGGVGHFYANLRQPITAANLLLQGHPASACKSLGRFAINTTVGVGGLFDPATKMRIPSYNEDLGQTLGHWGWRRSRYFLLPFFGPGTLRDRIGSLGDSELLGPFKYFQPTQLRVGLIGVSLVDLRARILPFDELSAGINDDYVLVREAWSQRRMHQIDDQTLNITDDSQKLR